MPKIISLNSTDAPGVRHFKISRHTKELQREGLFVAEGEKIISRLLDSGLIVTALLATARMYERFESRLHQERFNATEVYLVEEPLIESIVGYELHQGIMALGKVPPDAEPEQILSTSEQKSIIVALDGVVNTDNVGGIVRNSVAFGADLLISGNASASPYYRRAVRNSMGTVFRLPVLHTVALASLLQEIKTAYNFKIIGTHKQGGKQPHEINMSERTCILFGNEDSGIHNSLLDLCDENVFIPMQNETDSLNVVNASAVLLYEITRQRAVNSPGSNI